MSSWLTILAASSPGQRAGQAGSVALHIIAGILIFAVAAAILCLIPLLFGIIWRFAPWLTILWGISGIPLLVLGYIYASRTYYFVGGWDLGSFLVIWIAGSLMGVLEE
jgi:hypothetical protein